MTETKKAYCGDAIVKLMVCELGINAKYNSNKRMAYLWCFISGEVMPPLWNKKLIHDLGTKFELMIYDNFINFGYNKTKNYYKKLINDFVKA